MIHSHEDDNTLVVNNINFGNDKHNDKYMKTYKFNDKCALNKCTFYSNKSDNIQTQINIKKYTTMLAKATKDTRKKCLNTKILKEIKNKNKVTKCAKIRIFPSQIQKDILNVWFKGALNIYNECIDSYLKDKTFFKDGAIHVKSKIINKFNGEKEISYKDDKDNDYNDNMYDEYNYMSIINNNTKLKPESASI